MAVLAPSDAIRDARAAGLLYASDRQPGIRRVGTGRGLSYRGPDGAALRDREQLRRIRALAVPPAWTDVWIYSSPRGHIGDRTGRARPQAVPLSRAPARGTRRQQVGADDRLRRIAAEAPAAGGAGPRARGLPSRQGHRDDRPAAPRHGHARRQLRVRAANGSFGLTTLRARHVGVSGDGLRLESRGKSGKDHSVRITDRRIVRIVRGLQELPGQELFRYVDEAGTLQTVGSADVNAYLREATGEEFSAKDFRTWWGSALAVGALRAAGVARGDRARRRNEQRAMEQVAAALGNTPRVVRTSYVHPAVLESYADGSLFRLRARRGRGDGDLDRDERVFLALLRRLERAQESRARRAA